MSVLFTKIVKGLLLVLPTAGPRTDLVHIRQVQSDLDCAQPLALVEL